MTGKAELKTVRPLDTLRARIDRSFCAENSRAHAAKGRDSVLKTTARLMTGKAELKTVRPLDTLRARIDRSFCAENSRAHAAKARDSVPETRNFAMLSMNSNSIPEMRPRTRKIWR